MRRVLLVLLVPALALAACRPEEQTEEPPETVQETPEEAATTAPELAGTYRLVGVGDRPLPAAIGQVDECALDLTEGTLRLGADARYRLEVAGRTNCGDDEDPALAETERAVKEGPYSVQGAEVRFGSEVTPAQYGVADEDEAAADPAATPRADAEPPGNLREGGDLFGTELFVGEGVIRDERLAVRIGDDLTTLVFERQ